MLTEFIGGAFTEVVAGGGKWGGDLTCVGDRQILYAAAGAPPELMTNAKYIPGGDCIVYTCFDIHNESVVPLFHLYVSANVLGMQ